MESIANELVRLAANSSKYLDKTSRSEITRFIMRQRNADGGFCGRGTASDLYYTYFAVGGLKALGARIPAWGLWRYAKSFGLGKELDLVHMFCLIRLRSVFPMSKKTRKQLCAVMAEHCPESAYDLFLKILSEDYLHEAQLPEEPLYVPLSDPTSMLAAAVVVNRQSDAPAQEALLDRFCDGGGFSATAACKIPDLLSTATALFALQVLNANLDSIRNPCLDFVESLWRDSGGFAGHVEDRFEDVEYTLYALVAIGCLME